MLGAKQEAFCLHYAQTGKPMESYKAAGYKCKNDGSAAACATRLLKNAKVKERLSEITKELNSDKIATIREIQESLTAILRGVDQEEKLIVNSLGELERVRVVNQGNKIKAAELLAKMQGGFDNRLSMSVELPIFGGEDALED